MADSDITVTSLTATGGVGVIVIAPVTGGQSCLPYLQLAAVEIWEASTNNRNSSSYIGDTIVGLTRQGLSASSTRYYWARARDVSGNIGDWYPASATGGITGSTSSVAPGPNSVGPDELKDNAVTTPKLNGGAVTNAKLGALSVGSANMQNAAVDTAHIVDAAIVRAKLGSAAVGTANIENLAVTNAKISSIVADKVTAGTLQAGVIYSGTINANQINAGTLGAGVIYAGDINADNINSGTFTGRTFRTATSGKRIVIDAASHTFELSTNSQGTARIGFAGIAPTLEINAFGGAYAASFIGDAAVGEGSVVVQNPMFSPGGVALAVFSRGDGTHAHGFRGYTRLIGETTINSRGGQGIVAVSSTGGGHAFYAEKGGYGPFTGSHDAFIVKDEPTEVGDIVCDLKVVSRNGVDDTVTEVYVAEDDADPAAVGVVSRRVEFEPGALMGALPKKEGRTSLREILAEKYDRLAINSVGEGQVNVCGRGGNIAAGDLIMTSTLRGKGQRQPDGIVRNYTVAKAREDVTFSGPDDVKRCACIYHAG